MRWLLISLLAACAVLAACAAGGAAVRRFEPSDRAAITAVLDAQVAAWNRGDLEGYMAGYWNSPDLVFQTGSTVTRGWQATLERYRKRYQSEGKEMGQLTFEEVEVQALGPDADMARGGWRLRMKDGTEPHGLFTVILRRKAEGWRVVHDHSS